MATFEDKTPGNVSGRYYVDSSCIDCDLCRSTAPGIFGRDDELGLSIVIRQPVTEEEIALAEEAIAGCPTNSIGNDGPPEVFPAATSETAVTPKP